MSRSCLEIERPFEKSFGRDIRREITYETIKSSEKEEEEDILCFIYSK